MQSDIPPAFPLDRKNIPARISRFFGRSAIGWIVDVNTIGVTIAYAYTSAAALKAASGEKRSAVRVTGVLGIAVSLFFLLYFLIRH